MRKELQAFSVRWHKKSTLPLAIFGLLYLAVYSAQVIMPKASPAQTVLESASFAIWLIFAVDLTIRGLGAANLASFLRASWLEIISLAIPFVRILRVFRVIIALRGLKGFFGNRAQTTAGYIFMLVPLTWYAGGIAVLDAESSAPEASITKLGQALWWSLATITTVGYGDLYPTTFEGQAVAAVLMVAGISLFSAGAGIFASWILSENK